MRKSSIPILLPLALAAFLSAGLNAQARLGTGKPRENYQKYCAACHGKNFEGGLGGNLVDGVWTRAENDEEIAEIIRKGIPEMGMVPYEETFTDEEIRALVIFLREKEYEALNDPPRPSARPTEELYSTEEHDFRLEKVVEMQDVIWSMEFLPDGRILAAQLDGHLWLIDGDDNPERVGGTPDIWRSGQGGLMEVALHPDYEDNGWIYLAYAENTGARENGRTAGMTAIVRGRIDDGRWVDEEPIFHTSEAHHISGGLHFGTRLVFRDGYLYFPIGDRGRRDMAQDLTRPNGKIHRIRDDGRIPEDNPFYDHPNALQSIWSYGHRNPQGLDLDPATGALWSTEHGPRGGDELNLVEKGKNYGWPVITHGMNYNGQPITDRTAAPGMEQPVHYWVPSIAVCGIDFYEGADFPGWEGDLFISGLVTQELQRFRLQNGEVVEREIVLNDQGRVRDVHAGPDGDLYVILNGLKRRGPSGIYRMVPVD